jgi:YesN/AraC family two-component response regulator
MAEPARILIVDDDVGLVTALATALQFHYQVFTAHSGRAAFEILARRPVDLALLDHRLRDMEGVTILRFLKRLFPSVVVIYMTAYGSEDLAVEFYDSGGRRYLRKPFEVSTLLGLVDAYLAARRESRPGRRPVLEGGDGSASSGKNGPGDPRMVRARAYIEAHLPGPLRVQDVARAVGLSKSRFSQAFKQATGSTVEQFILRRRLANGIALLCDLQLTIKEVAAFVGISQPGNFARAFHQATRHTPSEFRDSLREKLAPRP